MPRDFYNLWCNAPALEQARAVGHPTGFLVEEETFVGIRRTMSRHPDLVEHVVQATELGVASRGFVGIVDLSSGQAVEAWQQRAVSRSARSRVEAATYPERLDDLIAMGAGAGDKLAENLRVGPFRIIADGSTGSRTIHCITPYPSPLPEYPNGKPNHTRSELPALLGRAREARLRAAVHVISDTVRHDVPDASEISGTRGPVEHAQCVAPVDLLRFARLRLVASIQPAHRLGGVEVVERVWPGARDHTYPMFDLLRVGTRLAPGSDVSVVSLGPQKAIEAACHRPYRTDRVLAPLAALWASARTALSIGQLADLALTADPGKVLLTMSGGRVAFSC